VNDAPPGNASKTLTEGFVENRDAQAVVVREGETLAGKYRVERVLGKGGMGFVVAAHHLQLDHKVAIKFMLPEGLSNQGAVARFSKEARAAVRIKSEHVARVIDVGTLDDGLPYMVMEYLDGSNLAEWLRDKGPLPIEQAVELVLQACEAIAEAHSLGIVHRDLKPANLFVIRGADGALSIKVLDFGISKIMSVTPSTADMTSTSAMLGSPLYMSPEQLEAAKDVDARTDIWALGVILHELVTGGPPFNADTLASVLLKIVTKPAPRIRQQRLDAPPELEAIILKCLEKAPEQRYPTIGALAVALAELGPQRAMTSLGRITGILRTASTASVTPMRPSASDTRPGAEAQELVASNTAGPWAKTRGTSKRSQGVLVGMAGVAMLGLGFAWLTKRASPSEPKLLAVSTAVSVSHASSLRTADPAPFSSNSETRKPATPAVDSATPSSLSSVQPLATSLSRAAPLPRARPAASSASPAAPKSAPVSKKVERPLVERPLLDDR
jgi:eukaryotic-like serine/threonine-protein kinase